MFIGKAAMPSDFVKNVGESGVPIYICISVFSCSKSHPHLHSSTVPQLHIFPRPLRGNTVSILIHRSAEYLRIYFLFFENAKLLLISKRDTHVRSPPIHSATRPSLNHNVCLTTSRKRQSLCSPSLIHRGDEGEHSDGPHRRRATKALDGAE